MLFVYCIYTRFLSVVRVLYIQSFLVLFVYCIYTRFLSVVRVLYIYKVS